MDTAISREALKSLLDQAIREVTGKAAGIPLFQGGSPPGEDSCTVYIAFRRGLRSSLTLCADTSLLMRIARNMMRREDITPEHLEDNTKEYFNILCGRISAALFRTARVSSRFALPAFYRGRYSPDRQCEQFVLSYSSDQNEGLQLRHYTPLPHENGDGMDEAPQAPSTSTERGEGT